MSFKPGIVRIVFWPDTDPRLVARYLREAGLKVVGVPVGDTYTAVLDEDAMVAKYRRRHDITMTAERIPEGEKDD